MEEKKVNERITPQNKPHLCWTDWPKGTWIICELIHSDAFRSLTKAETDILLFLKMRRQYPKKNKSYWNPSNRDNLKCPGIAIEEFFNGEVKGMISKSFTPETIRRAFKKFMRVGFLSIKKYGGNGPGDQHVYQLENNWRLWKKGDPPCYTKEGMSRAKGFCVPGSGRFENDSAGKFK